MKGLGEHSVHRHELGGVDQWPTQVIPAGKQRGLPTYLLEKQRWRLPATEFPSELCAILHDRQT